MSHRAECLPEVATALASGPITTMLNRPAWGWIRASVAQAASSVDRRVKPGNDEGIKRLLQGTGALAGGSTPSTWGREPVAPGGAFSPGGASRLGARPAA
jgi:hypothetical protein